ncbi:MAG: CHAT domain-containing protein [Oscillatoriophycideae cyanobacterium NC_groundwater_1537_Pr4_S-0.65um_50_18]|nr:CHAT domain-containing protein [Oscillatoriophycideae cyanobacterium NC_groundwater_1537_Pr4_S-0.65um_50_18]
MSKLVVISLGSGSLLDGFPRVTAQIWASGYSFPEQFIGNLPPAPDLIELYRNWQLVYQCLCDRQSLRSPASISTELFSDASEDELEIDESAITNVSQSSFEELCQKFQTQLNAWLASDGFLSIDRQLRSKLDPKEEIRITLTLNDEWLCRFPWQQWNLLRDYPKVEIALSQPEYKRHQPQLSHFRKNKVRILTILGDSRGIDVATETQFLNNLVDAEITCLSNPSRYEVNSHLWDHQGWDILFFAGHSQTQGTIGRLYINENSQHNSITIEQLEEALQAAIDRGLKLAIFNSCDGLGLALALEALHIPVVVVMREPVPNQVAQEFFRQFLGAFAIERMSLYLAVRQARRKLQGLEDDFPGASWLPVIFQNPAIEPPTWLELGGMPPCPYKGLQAFQETDAPLFFGREQATQDLAIAVKRQALVAVVGASGSGKSSVVFAGLVPYLRQHSGSVAPYIVSFRPGSNPYEALAEAIVSLEPPREQSREQFTEQSTEQSILEQERTLRQKVLSLSSDLQQDDRALCRTIESWVRQTPGTRFVLIADQFEELYSLCPEQNRQPFLDGLLHAVQGAPMFTLVLTLRADFYGYALSYRWLSDALQGAVYNLGSMSREELRLAIEQPAAQIQARLEPGLTDKLIQATWESAGHLPLLEFALSQLWSNQQGGWLTHQAYEAIGGVEAALVNHADAVYAQLSLDDRQRVQRIFIQLVQSGIGAEANRRIANRDEIGEDNWELVTRLASARLVVTNRAELVGEETVEVVHEALLRYWERLKQWIQTDSKFRYWQEDLRIARRRWENSNQDEELLLRGKALADAKHWYGHRFTDLGLRDKTFIETSTKYQERETQRRKRLRNSIMAGLTAGMLVTSSMAALAWWQWRNSEISAIQTMDASARALLSLNQEFDALLTSLRAGRRVRSTSGVDRLTQAQVTDTLLQAVNYIKEENRLEGHQQPAKSVAFSPDGNMILSAGIDNTVRLWNVQGQLLKTLQGHTGIVNSAVFNVDGTLIVSASADTTVRLWSKDGQLLQTIQAHSKAVNAAVFSPDGQTIASGGADNTIKLWNRNGRLLQTLKAHQAPVNSVVFSPDSQTIVSAGADSTVKLWSRNGTLLRTIQAHSAPVNCLAFSPDGQTIASAGADNTVKLWSRDGRLLQVISGHTQPVNSVSFSLDNTLIVSASADDTVKLWNTKGQLLQTFETHTQPVYNAVFSPDNKTIISTSGDNIIRSWNLQSQNTRSLHGHTYIIFDIAFSPDGQTLATASWDNQTKLWSRSGKELITLPKQQNSRVNSVSFNSDGQTLATGNGDGIIRIWTVKGELLKIIQGHQDEVWSINFSADGTKMISASRDKTAKIWSRDGKLLQTLKGHQNVVNSAAFSPDGTRIVTASSDATANLWSQDGRLLNTLKGHQDAVTAAVFSPDGQTIATASNDATVKLWSREGQLLRSLTGHRGGINSLTFSPDGKLIATASNDNTVKIWNSSDGQLLQTLQGFDGIVWTVEFGPDGKMLAVASNDNSVILFDIYLSDLETLTKFACNWIKNYLTSNANADQELKQLCLGGRFESR